MDSLHELCDIFEMASGLMSIIQQLTDFSTK